MSTGVLKVKGANETQSRLVEYLRGGRVHHALLLVGPDRDLKFQIAKRMAQAFLCGKSSPQQPFCGKCSTCSRVERGLHPDLLIFGQDSDDSIKIDTVRELCAEMEIGPAEGTAKICIVDEVQRMNPAAANAFLKTLEEPGPGRYFWLLTTQPNALLPTTRSRCMEFLFKPEASGPNEPDDRNRALLEETLRTGNPQPVVAAVEKDKERCLDFVRYLQSALRDATVGTPGALPELQRLGNFGLIRRFDGAVQLEGRLRSHANHGLLLEIYLRRELLAAPGETAR